MLSMRDADARPARFRSFCSASVLASSFSHPAAAVAGAVSARTAANEPPELVPKERVLAPKILLIPSESGALGAMSLRHEALNLDSVGDERGRLASTLLDRHQHPAQIREEARIVIGKLRE